MFELRSVLGTFVTVIHHGIDVAWTDILVNGCRIRAPENFLGSFRLYLAGV
jgi:hypothetical protein